MDKLHRKFDAIVCLSAIDWDFLWQRTQEIMSQFGAMGYPVLFVENTGARVPCLRDIPRVLNRLKKIVALPLEPVSAKDMINIKVLSPKALPFPYSDLAIQYNFSLIRREVLRFSMKTGIPVDRIFLWSYMTTPLALKLAESLPWAGVVVDLVSDPCKVKGAEAIEVSQRKILGVADKILCASKPVLEVAKDQIKLEQYNKLLLFEDGFSTRLPESIKEQDMSMCNKDRPAVTYIGGINFKIWWDAVSAMATDNPEIDFLFAGPKDDDKLPVSKDVKNVMWVPPFKEYVQLGCFLKKSCAGLIPYSPTSYVGQMRPAKINEYLVMGLPIVATKMPELERFAEEYGEGIMYLAETVDEFNEALKNALEEDCQELREKRQQIAAGRSWDKACKEIEKILQEEI